MNKIIYQKATEMCRELRKRSTSSEEKLWTALRNRKFHGKKFLRQHPLFFEYINTPSFFITDFYCREYKLVIEIDGKSHEYQKDYDELRTHIINALGIDVFRFKNDEIDNDLPDVLKRLEYILTQRTHSIIPL
jgi:very-short-patch-repair endonuclease